MPEKKPSTESHIAPRGPHLAPGQRWSLARKREVALASAARRAAGALAHCHVMPGMQEEAAEKIDAGMRAALAG